MQPALFIHLVTHLFNFYSTDLVQVTTLGGLKQNTNLQDKKEKGKKCHTPMYSYDKQTIINPKMEATITLNNKSLR